MKSFKEHLNEGVDDNILAQAFKKFIKDNASKKVFNYVDLNSWFSKQEYDLLEVLDDMPAMKKFFGFIKDKGFQFEATSKELGTGYIKKYQDMWNKLK